jgi:hypothetical protein
MPQTRRDLYVTERRKLDFPRQRRRWSDRGRIWQDKLEVNEAKPTFEADLVADSPAPWQRSDDRQLPRLKVTAEPSFDHATYREKVYHGSGRVETITKTEAKRFPFPPKYRYAGSPAMRFEDPVVGCANERGGRLIEGVKVGTVAYEMRLCPGVGEILQYMLSQVSDICLGILFLRQS